MKKKMTLQELAALRGVTKTEVAPADYSSWGDSQDVTSGITNKERREFEYKQSQKLALENRVKALESESGIKLEVKEIGSCDYLLAVKGGVPYFFCPRVEVFGKEYITPINCTTFNDYRSPTEFFESEEVASMPLSVAVKLWESTKSPFRHAVMDLVDFDGTVEEALGVVSQRNNASRAIRNAALLGGGRDVTPRGLGSGYDKDRERSYGGHRD